MNAVFVAILGALSVSSANLAKTFPEAPPWQYDYPYRGTVSVSYMSPELVHHVCNLGFSKYKGAGVPKGFVIVACSGKDDALELCEIVMPHKHYYDEGTWNNIWRHEVGHCNGWDH